MRHSFFALYWFIAFVFIFVAAAYLLSQKQKVVSVKDIPEPKKEEPKKELTVNFEDDKIQVQTPKAESPWKYLEEDGRDCFVFGDFKAYSNGDIFIGGIDTAINNPNLYNKLIQKLAIETVKNNYYIPDSIYYKEPIKPKKEKKKANT